MWKPYFQLPGSVYVLCLGTFVNRAGTFVLVFMALYLEKRLNLGVQFATQAMGAAGIGSLLAVLVGGHLADVLGRRIVIISSMLGGATVAVILSFLSSPWPILFAFVAFTFISDMYRPAVSAMISDIVEPARRPQAYALMYVSINLGFAIAPVIGGRLAEYSFKWLFWGDAATSAGYALIILIAIRETLPSRTVDPKTGASDFLIENYALKDAVLHILSNGVFMRFLIGMWLVALVFVQSQSTQPLYMNSLGFTEKQYGDVIAINGLLIVLAQLPITAVTTRFNRGAMLILAAMLTSIGFSLTGLATMQWHFVLVTIVWTLGEMIQAPLMSSIVGDLAPTALRARYMGALSMSFSLALAIGSPLGGFVLAKYGGAPLWAACLVLGVLAALLFASIYRRIDDRHVQSEAPPNPTTVEPDV